MKKEIIGKPDNSQNGSPPSVFSHLSWEQKDALRLDSPAIRMSACAGSGKTETLTARILSLIFNGINPNSIVAFTFTKKAAISMKSRLHTRIVEAGGLDARRVLGSMFMGTIHSYCLRLLQDHAGYDHYDVLTEHRERAFVIDHARELDLKPVVENILNRQVNDTNAVSIFLRSVSVVNDELMDPGQLKRFSPKFLSLLERYETIMKEHRLINFGQQISTLVRQFKQDENLINTVAGSIEHLLIDEYQDLNPAQEELVKLLISQGAQLFVVGDANQCIFQWRGSDVRCFQRFEQQFPNAKAFRLNQNRRSLPPIVEVANKFGRSIDDHGSNTMVPVRENATECVWWVETASPELEARWVADKILELCEMGAKFSDIAILLRSVNTSGGPFIDAFGQKGIPFILGGRIGIFRRKEAQALG